MAARSVPIPPLLERGTVDNYSCLFYEFATGEWPPSVDSSLARQMLALIDRQRDAARQPDTQWPARLNTMITDGDATIDTTPKNLQKHPTGRAILREAHSALQACDPHHLHTSDVVHGDCAPENVLVHEGQITAVVDWEQACYGDAAFDLAGLIYAAIHAQVPPDAWRLYTHIYAVRYASWAINTEMESQVLDTIARISR
jgi:aminoglycoside phosphotransferase (APT) family kinase protein